MRKVIAVSAAAALAGGAIAGAAVPASAASLVRTLPGVSISYGAVFDESGTIYASSFTANKILAFEPGQTTANNARALTGITGPTQIYRTGTGDIYAVGDVGGTSSIYVFRPSQSTAPIRSWALTYDADGVAVAPDGRVFVSDSDNNQIKVYPAGSSTENVSQRISSAKKPSSLAFDSAGSLYSALYEGSAGTTVAVYDPGASTPNPARTLQGTKGVYAVAVDAADRVYVTYTESSKSSARIFAKGAVTGTVAVSPTRDFPTGIGVGPNGDVAIANNNGSVSVYSPFADPIAATLTNCPALPAKLKKKKVTVLVPRTCVTTAGTTASVTVKVKKKSAKKVKVSQYEDGRITANAKKAAKYKVVVTVTAPGAGLYGPYNVKKAYKR